MPIRPLLKKDFKLTSKLLLVLLLIFLIQYPLQTFLRISDERALGTDVQDAYLIPSIFQEGGFLGAFAMVGVVLLAGMLIGMERNTRRHDFNLSLPYPRKDLFLSKAIIGLVAIVVIMTVTVLMACLIIGFSEYRAVLADFDVIQLFLIPLAAYLAIFSFALLMGCIAGEMISQMVLSFIFLFFPTGFTMLIMGFFTIHGMTFEVNFPDHFLNTVSRMIEFVLYMNPLAIIIDMDYYIPFSGLVLVLLVVFTFLCVLIGMKLYEKGKSERNGEFLLFHSLKPVFLVGIVGCFALLGGTIFSFFSFSRDSAVLYWFGAIIFGGIAFLFTKRLLKMNIFIKSR